MLKLMKRGEYYIIVWYDIKVVFFVFNVYNLYGIIIVERKKGWYCGLN